MNNRLKIKDVLLIALLCAIYMLLYFVSMGIIMPFGPIGHGLSPGVNGLLAGCVIYFMARKIGKMWQFSIMTLLVMGIFAMLGGGYLPWFITSMITAVAADFIASRSNESSVLRISIASGLMHMGQAWGAIIPATFFLNSYRETWIKRGQSIEAMNEYISRTTGYWGIFLSVLVFLMAMAGVYIGYLILRKHFKEV